MDIHLYHDSHNVLYRSHFGAMPSEGKVWLRLDIKGCDAASCTAKVRLWQSNEGEHIVPMVMRDGYGEARLTMPSKGCLVWYYFIVTVGDRTVYYGNNTNHLGGVGALSMDPPPAYQITVYQKDCHTPDWFKHAIVYQIFPDRFCRGRKGWDHLQGKTGAVIHSDWNDSPYYCKNTDTGDIVQYDFYGGDIEGIRQKLDYLCSLGVTAIYLNPVFESASNHRYSTADYHKIDSFFGSNEEFSDFCAEAKKKGIRIILDGVFSHTGADSVYFNRFGHYPSLGAYESKDSPYYEWYRFTAYPNQYESWWGVMDLPNVDETNKSYMDFIIHNDDSVLRHWIRAGISGWRLDVIDELPVPFLRDFYKTLKEEDPDAVLIGEVWEDASNKISYSEQREYLCGYDIDSAMNYALRKIAVDFILGRCDGHYAGEAIAQLVENYPPEHWYAMLNLISSHDIERILTVCDTEKGTVRGDSIAKARMKVLTAWQMTMPGAPCIYYGDEAGQVGGKDPDNRRTYPWGREDKELLAYVTKLTTLRKTYPALQTGRFIPLYHEGDVYIYARSIEGGKDVFGQEADDGLFIIAINRSVTSIRSVSLYTDGLVYGKLYDLMVPNREPMVTTNSRIELTLPPLSTIILKGAEGRKKRAGILLHPTSLASPYGHGDIGPEAYRFVDFLKTGGQRVWQILPLTPPLLGDSPYLSKSAFAMNEELINLDFLHKAGLLKNEWYDAFCQDAAKADTWDAQWQYKKKALWNLSHDKDFVINWEPYGAFQKENAYWLDDYALFCALDEFFFHVPWTQWPKDIRRHETAAVDRYRKELSASVDHVKFMQYIVHRQWQDLHDYAKKNDVSIMGDIPMFVAHNSADCWAHQELFTLDEDGNPTSVAGVPPDYFSADGQLWGNPLYDYDAMKAEHYDWWIKRFQHTLRLVDEVRIDHFRGFESYWKIPTQAKTAREGQWVKAPGEELFAQLRRTLGPLPLVAEDLGIITDDVCRLKDRLGLPGMKILQFHLKERSDGIVSFDTEPHCIAYTGTHDNNTLVGWYEDELDERQRRRVCDMVGLDYEASTVEVVAALIAYVYSRRAETVIIPMQDVLFLSGKDRMNTPGTTEGNWHWQLKDGMLKLDTAKWLSALANGR